MRLFSTIPNDPAVVSVAQEAYGLFAFGQLATGVIAIGQMAHGVVAIGQVAVGLVAAGQGAVGVYAGVGMLGVFGRGFPIPLLPRLPRPRQLPATTDLGRIRMGYGDGWIAATLGTSPAGAPTLEQSGRALADIKLSAKLVPRAQAEIDMYTAPEVIAHVRRVSDTLVVDRLLHVPLPLTRTKGFVGWTTVRLGVLLAMAIGVWFSLWPMLEPILR